MRFNVPAPAHLSDAHTHAARYHARSMQESKMVHLANEIARFWAAYPHDEALAGVAGHIRSFWEPRFRRQLVEYGQTGGAGLHDLVKEALQQLAPSTSTS
jgi:formate dehydrogenase subunit delta